MKSGANKYLGVLKSETEDIPVAEQVGFGAGVEPPHTKFNQAIAQIQADWILGTIADRVLDKCNLIYDSPTKTFLDSTDTPVVLATGARIIIKSINDLTNEMLFTANELEFEMAVGDTIDLTTHDFKITGIGCRGSLNFTNTRISSVLIEGSGNSLDIKTDLATSVVKNGQDIIVNGVTDKSVEFGNLLLNSDGAIVQRGVSVASVGNSVYGPDGFIHNKNGAMISTLQRTADGPTVSESGAKVVNCIDLTTTTIDASIAAGDYCSVSQPIEGKNILDIAGGFATIGFWVSSPVTGIHCCSFRNQGSGAGTFISPYIPDRSYVKEYTVDIINTWEFKTFTIPIDDSSGTWNYSNGMGLAVTWTLAAGSTYQTTAETWTTGNFLATASQVNVVGIVGAFKIAIPNLIKGQNYNDWTSGVVELDKAQERFSSTYSPGISPGTSGQTSSAPTGIATASGGVNFWDILKVSFRKKRVTPVVSFYNPSTGASGTFWDYNSSVTRGNAIVAETHSDNLISIRSSTATLLGNLIHGVHCVFDSDIYI